MVKRFYMTSQHALARVYQDFLPTTGQLLFLVAFVVVSAFPGKALAVAEETAFSWHNVVFLWDASLEDRVVVGLEAFSDTDTVGSLLRSGVLNARQSVQPGSVIKVLATAYSSTVAQTDANPFITASGSSVGLGVLAANFLPLGAHVRIGSRMYTVLDRMNSRYDGKYIVDIWMPLTEAALVFGARLVEMEIVSIP